jgi:ribosomal protein S18 acetylase RimI-like enzyme
MDPSETGSKIVIRPLTGDDLDAVVELSLRAWAPIFASFAKILGADIYPRVYPDWSTGQAKAVREVCAGDHVFVADVAGTVAGFSAVVIRNDDPKTGEIDMLAVDPDHQRHGVGSALIEHSVDHLRKADVVLVDVATGGDVAHAPARRAYEKAGFTPLPLVRYYKDL